jgi:hypothetical protein
MMRIGLHDDILSLLSIFLCVKSAAVAAIINEHVKYTSVRDVCYNLIVVIT